MLLVDLNTGDGRPIYGQIVDRVKFAVAGGVLRAGELVPSVRELSRQLVVNPNTVARAYRDLQSEGLLESVRGMGLQVTEGAADRCRLARREIVRQRLRQAIEEARHSSMDPTEIEVILRDEWAQSCALGNGPGSANGWGTAQPAESARTRPQPEGGES
jgi:GntR family transcriptional regulator